MINRKIKIFFAIHSSVMGGGAEDDALRILKYFWERNDRYEMHAIFPEGEMAREYKKYCFRYRIYEKCMLPVADRPILEYYGFLKGYLNQKRLVENFTDGVKFDIAIINVVVLIWFIYLLRKKGAKIITIVRETILPRFLRKLVYLFIRDKVDDFVFVSTFNMKDYQELSGRNNSAIYYTSVENTLPELNDEKELIDKFGKSFLDNLYGTKFKILCSGSVDDRKNQYFLLEVISSMKKRNMVVPYTIFAGDDKSNTEYVLKMKKFIEKEQLSEDVLMTGNLNKESYYYLFKKVDALVIVSKSEGLPIVVFEALKLGKPVISVDVGGVRELIENNVNGIVTPGDLESVSENIYRLMNDKSLCESFSRKGLNVFSRYADIENNMSVFEKLIAKNLLSR